MAVTAWFFLLLGGCDFGVDPGPIHVDSPVKVRVLEGAEASDTIGARLPVRVRATRIHDETQQPFGLKILFLVQQDGCGHPASGAAVTDKEGEAADVWVLGDMMNECTMEVRAVAPNGTLLGFTRFDVTVTPGEPVEGWLPPGTLSRGADSVIVSGVSYPLYDRVSNPLEWRFQMVSGPAVVLGAEFDDGRSRTLAATGEGSGEVDILSPFGPFLRARFDVCVSEGKPWIRVFRPEDAHLALGSCP